MSGSIKNVLKQFAPILFFILCIIQVGILYGMKGSKNHVSLGNFLFNNTDKKENLFLRFIGNGRRYSSKLYRKDSQPNCVIFSCSGEGYSLLKPSLKASKAKRCERIHFSGNTTDQKGNEIPANWCRVALLLGNELDKYDTIIYVDVDIVFNETSLIETGEKYRDETLIISKKIEKQKDVLRTCWFVLPNISKAKDIIRIWAKNWRNVYLQDQKVFNELWRCSSPGIQCLTTSSKAQTQEIRHCGSWIKGESRLHCLEPPKKV